MAIDKRFLYYTSEEKFLSDKNKGEIDGKSIAFISADGKRAIYTHGKFFSPEAFVVGTQTQATNAFTGTFNEIEKLYDGLSIKYWLPFNGTSTAATLNLNINGTNTGAIPVYVKGTTQFTTHIGANNILHLTYRENVGSIAKGWWVSGSYDSNSNTTYTFTSAGDDDEGGTFKVKPSNGSAQTVSVGLKDFTIQINSGSEDNVDVYSYNGKSPKTLNIKSGDNVAFNAQDGELTISATDTTYSTATQSANGLMSSTDKKKLDGIESGANNYSHPTHTSADLGFYKVEVDAEGHIESVTGVTKSDITKLGIPEADTHYESKNVVGSSTAKTNTTTALTNGNVYINSVENDKVTSSHKISGTGNTTVKTDTSGNIVIDSPTTIAWGSVTGKPTTFTPSTHNHTKSEITDLETKSLSVNGSTYDVYTDSVSLPTIFAPTSVGSNGQVLKSNGSSVYWGTDNNDNTWRGITLTDGTTDTSVLGTGTNTGSLKFKAGSNVSLSADKGVITVSATDTTYSLATNSKAGIVTIGTEVGKANGTASAGSTTGGKAAAVDHVHPLQTSVSGNAGTASKLAAKVNITLGGDVTGTAEFDGSNDITITTAVGNDSHSHSNSTITSLDASKITSGTISIDRLPQGALERLTVVADDTARFALTSTNIQLGDTVKVTSSGLMYYVKDVNNLGNANGYEIYTAGSATSVPWTGVTGKPTTFTPSTHSHDAATQSAAGFMSVADKKKLDNIAENANNYSHPTYTSKTSGFYKVTVDGTGHVSAVTNVVKKDITDLGIATNDIMGGASSSAAGTAGLVPAPAKGEQDKFLNGAGKWETPYTHPTYTSIDGKPDADATPGFGDTFTVTDIATNTLGHVTSGTSRTITIPNTTATTNAAGLMSATDKSKLDDIAEGATANKGTVTSVTIKNGEGIAVSSTVAITTSGERTISLSESGVTVNTDGTAKTYGNTTQQTPSHSGTFNIPYFTVDKYGRITEASTTTVKLPASGNTDTKVTSAANHYDPTSQTTSTFTSTASGNTLSFGSAVVTGFETDGKGHITKAITTKLPNNPNSDTKVKQSTSSSNVELPLLVGTTATPTSGTAYEAYYNTGVTMNPSTKTLTADYIKGNGSGLTNLNAANISSGTIGSARLPNHTHKVTTGGSVGSATATGSVSSSFTGTAHNHTFTGDTVASSTPTTGTTTVYSITGVGTLPSVTMPTVSVSYSSGTLTITHNAGSYTAGTLPTRSNAITVATNSHKHNVGVTGSIENTTATGTVSSSFTGTAHNHTFTGSEVSTGNPSY